MLNISNYEVLEVYPNPFSDKVNIIADGFEGLLKVNLYNAIGEEILNFETKENRFILQQKNLSKGIYYIKISDKNNKTGLQKNNDYPFKGINN